MIKKLTVKETRRERNEVEERKANSPCREIADVLCEYLWGDVVLHQVGMFMIIY